MNLNTNSSTLFKFQLCDSSFWSQNLTWNTTRPQLSPCFRNTLLVWFPAGFFILSVIVECFRIYRAKLEKVKEIPWNNFNVLRLLVTFILILVKLGEFFSYLYFIVSGQTSLIEHYKVGLGNELNDYYHNSELSSGDQIITNVAISSLLAPIIQASCYIILSILYLISRVAGLSTSCSIWFYLLFSTVCDLIKFCFILSAFDIDIYNTVEILVQLLHSPILIALFVLECRGDSPIIEKDYSDLRPISPELSASYFSSITFWWYNEFLIFGYKTNLKLSNLWKTLVRDQTSEIVPRFKRQWYKRAGDFERRSKSSKKRTYLMSDGSRQAENDVFLVLLKILWTRLLLAACLKLIQDSLQYVTPMILKKLIQFMSDKSAPQWHGTLYAISFLIIPTIQSLVLGNYFYIIQVTGVQVRTMIVGSIYRKSLALSGSSRLQSTSGEIVNLMAVDAHRFQELLLYANLLWSAPLQIVLAVYLLYLEVGWSVFAGVLCMSLVLPANTYLANRFKMKQVELMKTKDERVKLMNEVLNGIKVIKLYAWEDSFIENLFGLRNKELRFLRKILNLDAVMTFLWQCSPFVVAMVTFAVYVSVDEGNILTPEKAFVSIALFNLLRFPLTVLPSMVTSLVLTLVSSQRISRFLNSNELIRYVSRNLESEAISIEGGTLAWSEIGDHSVNGKNGSSSTPSTADKYKNAILRDIDLQVKAKSFVAIVGPVASGKSSLISAIVGEMHRISGRFNICQGLKLAYVPQQAWIQNMTVRDNILFGSPYNEQKYRQVLAACSLQSDLDSLPGGDLSEIGEKGINLSGGQKQRVSLARACYSDADIYLLDDPLSALDSHVAKHVFERVLSSSSGLLRDKTRVLATNSLFVLPNVDHIVYLREGRVCESGSYENLMKIKDGALAESMRQYLGTHESLAAAGNDRNDSNTTSGQVESSKSTDQDTMEKIIEREERIMKSIAPGPDKGRLIEAERMETGSVGSYVYLKYFKSVSWLWLSAVCISLTAAAGFSIATNLWLSLWSADSEKDPEKLEAVGGGTEQKSPGSELKTFRLIVYAALGGSQCLAALFGSLALSRGAVKSARFLHTKLLESVMHSPMSFFDTTPMGRIVNRFAKDIDVVDTLIPQGVRNWLNQMLLVLSTMFIICYSFPTFFAIVLLLSVAYFLIQKIFIVTTRQLKRLESTTRSPIYSHFSETLSGITTIRAYDCVDRFVEQSDNQIDTNVSCSYPNVIANRWLSVRLEFFGNLITTSAALYSVYQKGFIGASVAGLTISYSLNITQTLSWFIRTTSDLETHIVSVERILEYMNNKQEDLWVKENKRPPVDWPSKGKIDIIDYSSRYRQDTGLVLKHLTLKIEPGQRIGIVGRTGSGKSSLSLSLFRILEPANGKIVIDGLDVCEYGLHDLRSKLTIIPQDPVLFSGTLRFNLDPLKLYSDTDIWRALDLAHLKQYVDGLQLGLDYQVMEFGENFSVGQRQLICLARAILRKSKILILDEATASVDLETDNIVQKTIKDIFSDCTIITIAHRLHTILDSDKILVLDKGSIVELDSPENLISNSNSAFAALVHDAGIDTSSVLDISKARVNVPRGKQLS